MSLSLNEVAAQARKAARGAGFDWGLAEEAARAVRWLCGRGVDGVAALAACLDTPSLARAPVLSDGRWRGQGGAALCPIHVGAALSDRPALLQDGFAVLRIEQVAVPGLVLPFLASLSRRSEAPLRVQCGAATSLVDAEALDPAAGFGPATADLLIDRFDVSPTPRPLSTRALPDPDAWARLGQLAALTYAPATEASRARGAGGDLPDTD